MSETQRSFKKGDLVTGNTVYRPHITLVGEIVGFEHDHPVVHVEDGDNFYIRDFVIKHIRTPRKGGEEARAIVAMLASDALARARTLTKQLRKSLEIYENDYQNYADIADDIEEEEHELLFLIQQQKEYISKSYKKRIGSQPFKLYQKAKAMLK
jgi:hypothetical protein